MRARTNTPVCEPQDHWPRGGGRTANHWTTAPEVADREPQEEDHSPQEAAEGTSRRRAPPSTPHRRGPAYAPSAGGGDGEGRPKYVRAAYSRRPPAAAAAAAGRVENLKNC